MANTKNDIESSSFGSSYGSYSGSDIKVIVHMPNVAERIKTLVTIKNRKIDILTNKHKNATMDDIVKMKEIHDIEEKLEILNNIPPTKTLGEMQSISWSVARPKAPVRTLGSVYPRGYTRGPRTIAGTMIFTVFNKHVLWELLDMDTRMYNTGTQDIDIYQYSTALPDQLPPLDISLIFNNEYGSSSYMGLYGVEFVQDGGTFSIEDIYSEEVVQYVARDIDPISLIQMHKKIDGSLVEGWTKTASTLRAEEESINGHFTRRNPFI